jgi:predicted permease
MGVHLLFSTGDLRHAVRRLVRERAFTATVLLTLALCIGANVAIFAVVDAILIRSLPFPHAERLVITANSYPKAGVDRAGSSLPNYYDRRHLVKAFASTSIIQGGSAIVGEAGSPNRVLRDRVSPEFFATLGVPLAMGRSFTEDELDYARSGVAVITDSFWHSNFNADPRVLGRKFQVDTLPVEVIGVLPPRFQYLSSKAQFFIPFASDKGERGLDRRHSNNCDLIARLAPGATLAVAQAQIDTLNEQLLKDDPFAKLVIGAGFTTKVHLLHEDHVREVRPILLLLQSSVLFLLVIGGVNLVNLLLIRASGRAKELAVRQALGAGRRHIARDVLLETTLLAVGGGLLGLAAGAVGIRLLSVLGTDQLPLGAEIMFDGRVAAAALAASLAVGVSLALPVVWFNTHGKLASVLHSEARGGTVSRAAQRVRHGFIVAQISLGFILLAGSGLLGLSLRRVLATPPGFRAEHVLTGQISLPWKNYPDDDKRLAFVERLVGELRILPGVTSVGICSGMPFSGNNSNNATVIEGVELKPGDSIRAHNTAAAVGEYWSALGIPLISGRFLEDADNHRKPHVCVVDEAFARRYWPNQSALGHRLVNGAVFKEEDAHTIVGVVGNVKQSDLTEADGTGSIYYPYSTYSSRDFSVVIRTPMAPDALASMLKKTVLKIDPELPVDDLKPMQARVEESLVSRRSPALLAGIFSAVALVLTAVGTYGVLAYAVSQRRREIGVRMALGALPQQVLTQFLGLGARLLLAGVAIGVLGAWGAGQAMKSVLYGVGTANPWVLAATAGLMALVVLVAVFLPSYRASRVSPIDALRDD